MIDHGSLTIAAACLLVVVLIVVPVVGSAVLWLVCFGLPMAAIELWFSVALVLEEARNAPDVLRRRVKPQKVRCE